MSEGFSVKVPQSIVFIRNLSRYGGRPIFWHTFLLTARQYGAFVLADAASGQSPVTPRQRGHKTCTRTAKTTPYPPCTVTAFWPTGTDLWRCCRRVTQPPHIAGPLAVRAWYRDRYQTLKIHLNSRTNRAHSIFKPGLIPSHKQEFGSPSLQSSLRLSYTCFYPWHNIDS